MKRWLIFLGFAVAGSQVQGAAPRHEEALRIFEQALDLIESYSGSGDELEQAKRSLTALTVAHPNSGYAQTLSAELMSITQLDQRGEPDFVRKEIVRLTNQALLLNPDLAYAHVPRARAALRRSKFDEANRAIDEALKVDPGLARAMFMRAEIYRKTAQISEADTWYRRYIEATPTPARRAGGYYGLARMYEDAAANQPNNRVAFMVRARKAYQTMVVLVPSDAERNLNFATFLNGDAGDFDAAEFFSYRALSLKETPAARQQWAVARYQKVAERLSQLDDRTLRDTVGLIASSTGISLAEALKLSSSRLAVRGRLEKLQARLMTATPRSQSPSQSQSQS